MASTKIHPTWEKELSDRAKDRKGWVAVPRHLSSKEAHANRKRAKQGK